MEGWAGRRCLKRIHQWAADNHFGLGTVKRSWFSTGSWGARSGSLSHRLFDVVVTDETGTSRSGMVRMSGGLGGLVANVLEVRWADPARTA